jgi:ElaB/YqjD/DUF883 family membrane-anchored ribosome-binding protein
MTSHAKTHKAEDNLASRLQDAGERIIEFKDETTKTLGKRIDAMGALMKKHPIAALGLGVGTGYLLARILHR